MPPDPNTIYQASDLANRRVEFLDAARKGGARLRHKDGTSLVMLPEHRVLLLEELSDWSAKYMRLESLLRRTKRPNVDDLGDLAWLRVFDEDDLQEFLGELHDVIVASRADESTQALDLMLQDWRTTAEQLSDPLRRSVLRGELAEEDLVEASRPDGS